MDGSGAIRSSSTTRRRSAIAFSPDGKILADAPGRLESGDTEALGHRDRRELDLLAVVPDDARALAFMPDGRSLATAGVRSTSSGLDGEPAVPHLERPGGPHSDRSPSPPTARRSPPAEATGS